MCRLSKNHNPTHPRRRNHSRLWSQYQQEKTHKRLNRCHRTTTSKRNKTLKKKKKMATRLKVKKMKTTLLRAMLRKTRYSTMPMRSKLLEMKPQSPLAD
jgi:hypothetical protein